MIIQHNISALNAYRQMGNNTNMLSKNLEKLSSGYKINRAGDDAAGLAISEKMRAQIKGLEAAQSNSLDGISLIQTAEGALTEVHSMLNRMTELATKAANGTYQGSDRQKLTDELSQLKEEIDRISEATNFNGIKLLDGSLSSASSITSEIGTASVTSGVTVAEATAGQGSKGEFTVDISGTFGTGDSISINALNSAGTAVSTTMTFTNAASPGASEFGGATKSDQAAAIAAVIASDTTFADFDIKAEGSKIIFTAKSEGAAKGKISGVTVVDSKATIIKGIETAGASGTTLNATAGLQGLNSVSDFKPGDVLRFTFTVGGEALETEIQVTADMIGPNAETITNSIAKKLAESSFKDKDVTAVDESKLKVGDFFDIKGNMSLTTAGAETGTLLMAAKQGGSFGFVRAERSDGSTGGLFNSLGTAVGGTIATTGIATYANTASLPEGNFAAGDKFKISGKLGDGSKFELVVEAGKDFAIGATADDSLTALVSALESTSGSLKTTDGKFTSDQLFGTGKEFTAANVGTGTGLGITSGKMAGLGGSGIEFRFESADVAKTVRTDKVGLEQTAAKGSITFGDGSEVKYGTAIKIKGETFELVNDPLLTTSRGNNAVVLTELEKKDSTAIAAAFKAAIDAKFGATGDVSLNTTVEGGTLKYETAAKGSTVSAVKAELPYGETVEAATVKFDMSKLSAGQTVGFNGNTYEFVENMSDAKEGNIAIAVGDFSKATAKDVATEFANVIKNGSATVASDGTMTIRSGVGEDGKVMKLELNTGSKALVLQVGETADAYQKVSVGIGDMSATGLGIKDISIGTQEGAADAIGKIKEAIDIVSTARGGLGALQNRVEHTINNLGVTTENLTAAESRIRDTDMAKEMMSYTKNNVLIQASQAMLAQANQQPQSVLQLLQ